MAVRIAGVLQPRGSRADFVFTVGFGDGGDTINRGGPTIAEKAAGKG
jgi:hypothetical protein